MSENRFDELFTEADAAFNGKYKDELNALSGLSREEIDAVCPSTTDLKTYNVLTKVVEQASKENWTQGKLVENIQNLGDIAVKIAKKIPQLRNLL